METLAYLQAVQDENTEHKLSGKMTGVMLGAAGVALAVGAAQAPAQAYGYDKGDYGCFERCEPVFLGGGYQVTSFKTYEVSFKGGYDKGCYDDCGYGISYPSHDSCYDYCDVSYGGFSTYDIQSALSYAGFHVSVDGVYGPETHHAVVAFQLAVGLVPDGIVGPATASALGLY